MHIVFDESKHIYYNKLTNERYISATQILSKFKKPFDRYNISLNVARKEGVTQQEILDRWDNIKNIACDKGKSIHLLLEQYILLDIKNTEYDWIYTAFDNSLKTITEKYDYRYSEKLLYNDNFKIAGTCDLLVDIGDEFCVIDFKTNNKITTSNNFNEYLLYPLDFLQNCEYNVYALQLSLYAYMYEKQTGKKPKNLCIFYLKDEKIIPFNVPYLKLEVIAMLQAYRANNNESKTTN